MDFSSANILKIVRQQNLAAPVFIILLLAMILLPMPVIGLDLLFTFNIALSLVILLVTVYALRPLDFTSFPTVLLLATMLRLALNIASTRVVLLEGHTGTGAAGEVIEAFGNFVIGGNYAVGFVIFSILVVINFVVVTKGAGRVSEVSARFVLDAMPGKQMAIDADLNSGVIDQDEARKRRTEISEEADFYGSMDGASKFVRGDAIAGLLILFINIIGGFAIGMGSHKLSFTEAAHNYALLTIGDGLVAQIPSIFLSVATAIIVTRVSTTQDLGKLVNFQLFDDVRALSVTAAVIGLLGLVPGMPNLVFLLLSAVLFGFVYYRYSRKKDSTHKQTEINQHENVFQELDWEDVKGTDVLGIEIGYRLIPLIDATKGGNLADRIRGVRRKLTEELGFLVQTVHIKDNPEIDPGQYRIILHGVVEAEALVYPDKELAINSAGVDLALSGKSTIDPAYGMPATWIDSSVRDEALSNGYTVVDCGTVIATHLSKIITDNASEILGYEEVQKLVDKTSRSAPNLVSGLIPDTLTIAMLVKILKNLLSENIPITNIRVILETLAETASSNSDIEELTSAVRVALRRQITHQVNPVDEELRVITLAPNLENVWLKSIQSGIESGLGIAPDLAEKFYRSLGETASKQEFSNQDAVLLVNPKLRPWLAGLIKNAIPQLKVLAYSEIAEHKRLKVIANIGGDDMNSEPILAA